MRPRTLPPACWTASKTDRLPKRRQVACRIWLAVINIQDMWHRSISVWVGNVVSAHGVTEASSYPAWCLARGARRYQPESPSCFARIDGLKRWREHACAKKPRWVGGAVNRPCQRDSPGWCFVLVWKLSGIAIAGHAHGASRCEPAELDSATCRGTRHDVRRNGAALSCCQAGQGPARTDGCAESRQSAGQWRAYRPFRQPGPRSSSSRIAGKGLTGGSELARPAMEKAGVRHVRTPASIRWAALRRRRGHGRVVEVRPSG